MVWISIVIGLILIIASVVIIGFRKAACPRLVSAEGIDDEAVIEAYDRISRWPQFKLIRLIILNELKKHHPEGSLADVGCGPGYFIATLAKALPNLTITGVDISDTILYKAKQNLAQKGLAKKVNFRQGDIQKLPFEPDSLDFVISTLSLHHWSNPEAAIEEISRVLKTGGQFLIFDVRRDSPRIAYWVLRFAQTVVLPAALGRANEPTLSFLAGYTQTELEDIMSRSSFKEQKIHTGLFWLFVWGKKRI